MERKGGCCLAPRYGAGGQAWQMGRIMLKFRPIAPKPAAMVPAPVMAPAAIVGAGKGKRKAVGGGGGGRRGRKPKKAATTVAAAVSAAPVTRKVDDQKDKSLSSPSSSSSGMTSVDSSPPPPPATLPLMPVPSVEKEAAVAAAAPVVVGPAPAHGAGHVVAPHARRPAASWVTVEDVTATWRDGESPSAAACGGDDAPAFVSDQRGRVTWTNAAFSRAVSGAGDDDAATDVVPSASEVPVVLAAKDGAAVPAWGTCAGFTCRVRVLYACPRRGSLVAPCDVWRLDAGGYLWRLDLQATLSLSLGGLL